MSDSYSYCGRESFRFSVTDEDHQRHHNKDVGSSVTGRHGEWRSYFIYCEISISGAIIFECKLCHGIRKGMSSEPAIGTCCIKRAAML